MASQQDFAGFFKENKQLLKEYIDVRAGLLKLQAVKILSRSLSLLLVIVIVSFLALFVILFLGMSFAWWIAELTQSNTAGFAAGAGLFVVLLLLVIALRRPLFQNPLIRIFITESVKEMEETETE
ncbi:MAG: hypothetical protein SFU87_00405 [Chitinophagaceae bacterium]|nr:hypothetical protein [Chitinophagaceae bacterium]